MKNLIDLRTKMNLSQAELAEKLGLSQQTISKYERGLLEPDLETLGLLSDIFDVSIDHLLGRPSRNPDDDEVWELRDMLHKRPEMKTLLHASQKVTREDIEKVSALVDSLKKTNPEFGGEE